MSEGQFEFTFEETAVLSVDQLWSVANEELLRIAKEDRRVERKPTAIRPRELSEYFSMQANTAIEGGLIVVGMADKGQVLGCLGIEIEPHQPTRK